MVEQICHRWQGELIVSVPLFLGPGDRKNNATLLTFAANASSFCGIGLNSLYEITKSCGTRATVVCMIDNGPEDRYPINKLRNIGINLVSSSHYLMLDIDLWPSECLHDRLLSILSGPDAAKLESKAALVVAPLQHQGVREGCTRQSPQNCSIPLSMDDPSFPSPEDALLFAFHTQSTIDIAKWYTQLDSTLEKINCFHSNHFEPYIVVKKCIETPLYDERYIGYGGNKIELILRLRAAGWFIAFQSQK